MDKDSEINKVRAKKIKTTRVETEHVEVIENNTVPPPSPPAAAKKPCPEEEKKACFSCGTGKPLIPYDPLDQPPRKPYPPKDKICPLPPRRPDGDPEAEENVTTAEENSPTQPDEEAATEDNGQKPDEKPIGTTDYGQSVGNPVNEEGKRSIGVEVPDDLSHLPNEKTLSPSPGILPGSGPDEDDGKDLLIQRKGKLDEKEDPLLTIYGWYYDGHYYPKYKMSPFYEDYFQKEQQKFENTQDLDHNETHEEKKRRYFWPPSKGQGMTFRTRGIYLDFKECVANPPPKYVELDEETEKRIEKKIEERKYRRKLIRRQIKAQRQLEYMRFPTIMGWYFDGFFTKNFLLNEKWAGLFNQKEEELAQKKIEQNEETFEEKSRRNFWPPKYYFNSIFRTRGIYMDHEEVMKDPPHLLPDVDLEALYRSMWGDTIVEEDTVDEVITVNQWKKEPEKYDYYLDTFGYMHRREKCGIKNDGMKHTDWYFDDEVPAFFLRDLCNPDLYYWDRKYKVWRIRRGFMIFPNDYYFDTESGKFIPKDREKEPKSYIWEKCLYVWVKKDVSGESSKSLPTDYYFDERRGTWNSRPGGIWDQNGARYALKNIRCHSPDDYYFYELTARFKLKEKDQIYYYDPEYGAWRKTDTNFVNKSGRIPFNYYWDMESCKFKRKDAPRIYFEFDTNNRFYRRTKILKGLHNPRNWYWNEEKHRWLPKPTRGRWDFFSEMLNWHPQRDYDRPWLDHLADYEKKDFDHFTYQEQLDKKEKAKALAREKELEKRERIARGEVVEEVVIRREEVKVEEAIDPVTEEPQRVEWTERKMETGPEERVLSNSKLEALQQTGISSQEARELAKADFGDLEPSADDEIQRKVLKISNMNGKLTDHDVKAYFYDAHEVIIPKHQKDFGIIFFQSEEGATAAYRTMQGKAIKGQQIKLSFVKKSVKAGSTAAATTAAATKETTVVEKKKIVKKSKKVSEKGPPTAEKTVSKNKSLTKKKTKSKTNDKK